jgi:hypothetical protein
MTLRIQPLLKPMAMGGRNLGDVMISMPEEIAAPLRQIFRFDVG